MKLSPRKWPAHYTALASTIIVFALLWSISIDQTTPQWIAKAVDVALRINMAQLGLVAGWWGQVQVLQTLKARAELPTSTWQVLAVYWLCKAIIMAAVVIGVCVSVRP